MDFIANNGSYDHRGVWHITDNLTREDFPATVERFEHHWNPGHVTISHKPAHVIFKGDAICGQKDGMKEGGLDWGKRVAETEMEYIMVYRPKRPNVVLGLDGYIPGPLCTRCAKKAGINPYALPV